MLAVATATLGFLIVAGGGLATQDIWIATR
jgi:hypothetical protein